MSNITSATHINLARTNRKAPSHKRLHATPANKLITFYIGVEAPSIQSYALLVKAGKAPVLTLDQVLSQYGAPQASIDKVTAWAKKTGHVVLGYDPFMKLLKVQHNAAAIRSIYGATLNEYDDGQGNIFTGRNKGLKLPVEAPRCISRVVGIDGRPHARTKHRIFKQISSGDGKLFCEEVKAKNSGKRGGKKGGKGGTGTTSGTNSKVGRSWNPVQLAAHYGVHRNKLGAGQAGGFISLGGGLDTKVLARANARLSLKAANWTFLFADGATNSPNADGSLDGADGENYLDAQMWQAICPEAELLCGFATNTGVGIAHGYAILIQHKSKPKSLTGSWGQSEDGWSGQDIDLTEETLASGVAMGINFFNAAGDDGSNDNVGDGKAHSDYPASSKFNTACSGVFDDGKTVTAWGIDVPNNGSTGGGVSVVFAQYTDAQLLLSAAGLKLIVNADTGLAGRILGDIAGMADPRTGIEVMDGKGRVFVIGGTSAVSPFSGAAAAATAADLGRALGDFNMLIYKAAAAGKSVCVVVTSGSNGAYTAKPGDVINFCGLGVVDWNKVFILLSAQAA